MNRRFFLSAICAMAFAFSTAARADYDEKDVKKIAEAIQNGKRVYEMDSHPRGDTQVVVFGSGNVRYTIDVRAQLCFAELLGGSSPGNSFFTGVGLVPCAALKKGYPLMAPIITWVE